MCRHRVFFEQQKSNSTPENSITRVRGCVCLTFDRLRGACVASILRVFLWLGWLGLLAVGRQPTNWTGSFSALQRSCAWAQIHTGLIQRHGNGKNKQTLFFAEQADLGPSVTHLQRISFLSSLLAGDPPRVVPGTQATNRHAKSRQHRHCEDDQRWESFKKDDMSPTEPSKWEDILGKPLPPSVHRMDAPVGWTVRHDKSFALLGAAFCPPDFCLRKILENIGTGGATLGPTHPSQAPCHRCRSSSILPWLVADQLPRAHDAPGEPPSVPPDRFRPLS